jgi:MFS superfamily sulfate permease-like transporter
VLVKGFEFSLRELAGGLSDFTTLIPFAVGYIVLCGFDVTGLLLGIGLTNIILGLVYRLPLPVQPKKVIGSVALAERWPMTRIINTGFVVGLVWIVLTFSNRGRRLLQKIPLSVVRGIQLSLAFTLAFSGIGMMRQNILLASLSIIVALVLLRNRILPSSLFLIVFGFVYAMVYGSLNLNEIVLSFSLPSFHPLALEDMFFGFIYAGLSQIFLTLTNAVISTLILIRDLFPSRKDITHKTLVANMAAINITVPFLGGMPLCHGSGGLASQYLFGARTGGALLMIGLIEVCLGLFFSQSILTIFTSFPQFILGVMLLLASLQLAKISFKIQEKKELLIMFFTAFISVVFNIIIGFFAGILLNLVISKNDYIQKMIKYEKYKLLVVKWKNELELSF